MHPLVRRAKQSDIEAIAAIHREAFPRQHESETWVRATLAAAPRMLVFVLEYQASPVGYIFWAQKSGIRPSAVVELDQVAVLSRFQGMGFGECLVKESLALVKSELSANHQTMKSLIISTRADNQAQRLYVKVLGAKIVATIENLYSATEVLMVAECPDA
jgi:ribosomal protein S18 acetylase RimI-like enzyme